MGASQINGSELQGRLSQLQAAGQNGIYLRHFNIQAAREDSDSNPTTVSFIPIHFHSYHYKGPIETSKSFIQFLGSNRRASTQR